MTPASPSGLPWHHRLRSTHLIVLLVLLGVASSLPALRGAGRDLDYLRNLLAFLGKFFPPDFSVVPKVLVALGETAQIAIMATLFSMILSLPLAVLASRTLSPRWLVLPSRLLLNAIRTIPSLIWALIAVAIVGANPLAGVIALTFYSIGYLGKFYSDAFESVDLDVAQGLRAMGADALQSFQYGLWPHAKPLIWSNSLWMLEYNIRSAAIIGYVGAGGIGTQLHTYQEYGRWDGFCTVLIFIFILVTVLDFCGEWARKKSPKKSINPSLRNKFPQHPPPRRLPAQLSSLPPCLPRHLCLQSHP
ncbi:MAG: phosphonate ABC transporter, permease protein PhnE [Blastochloris sp.]|nr:phosphonate ABC transporter, permease protein PhnE [Blastochloris sp.]